MRILFIGGFLRGYKLLKRLVQRGETVVGAFICAEDPHEETQLSTEMLAFCGHNGIPAERTRRIPAARAEEIRERFCPDVIFCLGWRTLLSRAIREIAPQGVVAAHDSLLPRLRGFAPTNWGIILGHSELGVTLFQLSEHVDDGEVFQQSSFHVGAGAGMAEIQHQVATSAVSLFEQYIDDSRSGRLSRRPQNESLATYACARNPEDGEIDWSLSSVAIQRLVTALAPPGPAAFSYYEGEILQVIDARALDNPPCYEGRIPGRIVARDVEGGTVDVLSGDGLVRLHKVARQGQPVRQAADLLRSVRKCLGMNPRLEIVRLRGVIADLENRVRQLETASESLPPSSNLTHTAGR